MKRIRYALAALAITSSTFAQTPQATEDALKDALHNKTLFVQGFSAEKEVHFVWTGTSLELPDPVVRTLGALKVKNVKVTSDHVEIGGDRSTLLKKPGGGFELSGISEPVKLIVELRGADPSTLSRLPDVLFFHDEQQAMANVPEEFRQIIPAPSGPPTASPGASKKSTLSSTCDCTQNDEHNCGHKMDSPGWQFPKRVSQHVQPQLTTTARISGQKVFFSGVAYGVTADGHTTNLWLGLPAGYGIDEQFLAIMAKTKFQPATCHGKPEAVAAGFDVITISPR